MCVVSMGKWTFVNRQMNVWPPPNATSWPTWFTSFKRNLLGKVNGLPPCNQMTNLVHKFQKETCWVRYVGGLPPLQPDGQPGLQVSKRNLLGKVKTLLQGPAAALLQGQLPFCRDTKTLKHFCRAQLHAAGRLLSRALLQGPRKFGEEGSQAEPFCRDPCLLLQEACSSPHQFCRAQFLQRPLQGRLGKPCCRRAQVIKVCSFGVVPEFGGSSGSNSCASMAQDTEPQFLGRHLH